MSRFYKYSLVTFIVIFLITGLIITVITQYNPNAYKPLITQWVKDKKQRDLKLDGDIKLTIFPQFGLNISRLSLSELDSHEVFFHIENIQLSLSLWPLLSKQLVIHKLAIQGLDATLILFADGRTNIDDLLSTDDDSPAFEFDIEQLHIEKAELLFQDDKNQINHRFSNLTLMADKITSTSLKNLKLHALGDTKQVKNNDSNQFEVKLDIPALQFTANHIASDQINIIAKTSHLGNSINGAVTLSNITSAGNHLTSDMLTIELVAEQDAQIINLFINSPLSGNFDTQELALSDLELNLRLFQPRSPETPISGDLQGQLHASNKTAGYLQANFSGNLEDSQIKAEFNLNDFNMPALQFAIDIDRFNMNHYLSASRPEHQPIKNDKDPANRNNESLDLASLADLNTNGTIRIGLFQSKDISLSDIQFNIQTNNGQLQTNQTH